MGNSGVGLTEDIQKDIPQDSLRDMYKNGSGSAFDDSLVAMYAQEDLESLLLNEEVALRDLATIGEDRASRMKREVASRHLLVIHRVMLAKYNWLTREFIKESGDGV